MRVTSTKVRIIGFLFASFFLVALIQPILMAQAIQMRTSETYDGIEGFDGDYADLGIHIYFNYANVTFTTDGSGSDNGMPSCMIGTPKLKLSPSARTITNIRFGVGVTDSDENLDLSSPVFKSTSLQGISSNLTTNQVFEFDERRTVNLVDKDLSTMAVSSTNINVSVNKEAVANLQLDEDYLFLNDTLADWDEQYPFEDGYFANSKGRLEDGKYKTFLVGYENYHEGAKSDLKKYISLVTGADTEDIKIQATDLSGTWLAYNTTLKFDNWMKSVLDNAIDRATAPSSFKIIDQYGYSTTIRSKISSLDSLSSTQKAAFLDGLFNGVAEFVNGAATTIGQGVGDITQGVGDYFSDPLGETQEFLLAGTDAILGTVGGILGQAVNHGSDVLVDLSAATGDSLAALTEKPMASFGSFFGELIEPFLIFIPVIAIIIVVGVVGYFLVRDVFTRFALGLIGGGNSDL